MEEFQIKYFSKNLKKIAKNDFGGVGKLAVEIDLSQSHLSKYMGGKVEPGVSFTFKLAKLNVDINKLLTGESHMNEGVQKQINELKTMLENQQNEINKWKAVTLDLKEENEQLKADKELLLSQVSSLNKAVHAPKTNITK